MATQPPTPEQANRGARHLTLAELMLLVASVAVGLWLFLPSVKSFNWTDDETYWALAVAFLSGPSWIGPPIILWRRRHDRRRSSGRLMWFVTGVACWGMWPAILVDRFLRQGVRVTPETCFIFVVPLMSLFLLTSLLAIAPTRIGSRHHSAWWGDLFGLLLGYAWAAVGLYVLAKLYLGNIR